MNIITKAALALLLATGCFAAGWFSRDPSVITKTDTKIEYKDRVQTITKTVFVKETKPDGTVTETTTTDAKSDSKSTTKQPTPQVAQAVVRKDWSIGVQWRPDFRDPTWVPAGGSVGYRVVSDLWVDAAVTVDKQPGLLVGLRWEF